MSEENKSSISDLLDSIESGNYNVSSEIFNDVLGDKIQASLDAEKLAIAQDIYNNIDDELDELEGDEEVEYVFDDEEEDEIDLDDDFDVEKEENVED